MHTPAKSDSRWSMGRMEWDLHASGSRELAGWMLCSTKRTNDGVRPPHGGRRDRGGHGTLTVQAFRSAGRSGENRCGRSDWAMGTVFPATFMVSPQPPENFGGGDGRGLFLVHGNAERGLQMLGRTSCWNYTSEVEGTMDTRWGVTLWGLFLRKLMNCSVWDLRVVSKR